MTVLRSLSGGLLSSRTGVLQALLHRVGGLPAAVSEPVFGLTEKNLSPLITLPCLLLLGDEIASQKADCYSDQKDYEQIVFQILVPGAHCAAYLIFMSIAWMIFGENFLAAESNVSFIIGSPSADANTPGVGSSNAESPSYQVRQYHRAWICSKDRAAKAVNQALVLRNWIIGARLIEFDQSGQDRATYGEQLLANLAADLKNRRLKGLGISMLKNCPQFYRLYSQIGRHTPQISQSAIGEIRSSSTGGALLARRIPFTSTPAELIVTRSPATRQALEEMSIWAKGYVEIAARFRQCERGSGGGSTKTKSPFSGRL